MTLLTHWLTFAAIVINSDLKVQYEAKVDFDADLSKYGIKKGVHVNESESEVYAPVAMWLEAVDLVLQRLKEKKVPFNRIKGISGAGQQHGSVYWNHVGEELLASLKPDETLVDQLSTKAFAHPYSPNWQDASTQKECDKFDQCLGSPEKLAEVTGSKAHHVSPVLVLIVSCLMRSSDSLALKSCVSTRSIQKYTVLRPVSHLSPLFWHLFSSAVLPRLTSVMSAA